MFYHIRLRNEELMRAYIREKAYADALHREGAPKVKIETVMRRAIERGAPRFYMTYTTALNMLSRRKRPGWPFTTNVRCRRQWLELAAAVDRRVEQTGGAMTRALALVYTLALEPASGFFISVRQGMAIKREMERYYKPLKR